METKYAFLTYNTWTDNDIHMGHSINIDGLTYEDIVEAIERQQWIKEHNIELSNEDLLEIENLKDYKERLKKEFKVLPKCDYCKKDIKEDECIDCITLDGTDDFYALTVCGKCYDLLNDYFSPEQVDEMMKERK